MIKYRENVSQQEDSSFSLHYQINKHNKKMIFKELIIKLVKKMRNERSPATFALGSSFSQNINRGALSCFVDLCQALTLNNRITEVNLAGCNINIYYAIELANLVQNNVNIQILNLAGCNLNAFSLSCIFKAMIDHTGLTHLNLFNNQNFTTQTMQDFCKYVLNGKNSLEEINLNHCNLDNNCMNMMLPHIKYLKSLKRLKIGMMQFNSESILSLAGAMRNYTSNQSLDYLDLACNQIKNEGLQLLSGALFISVRQINIRSINLSKNGITQEAIEFLEQILLKLNVDEINLSNNKITEFQNQQVLNKKILRLNLSQNKFIEIPNNFFLNVLSLNLSNNLISTQGAYQISQVLTSKKVYWRELNLDNNNIRTKGFISLIYALIENQYLTHLSVANNSINGEAILVYVFNHEQLILEYLNLSFNFLRYDLVYALISMMKECKLKTLVLSSLAQDENEIQSLKIQLFEIKCTNLKELDFSGNQQIIKPILDSLAKQYNRIEYLNLNHCGIKSKHIEPLSQFIERSYNMHTLTLSNNNLGNLDEKDLKQLERAFQKNFSIKNLDLSCNRLKQKVLYLYYGLQNCGNLRYLNLSKNLIDESDDIIRYLPNILRNPNLQQIDLSKNYLRSQTIQQMRYVLQRDQKQFPQISFAYQKLTADDLVVISDVVGDSYSLRKLDLSGNMMLDYLNNVLTFEGNFKVESLSINKIQFRKDSFDNLINIMIDNYKNLRIVEVSNTFLSQNQLILLFGGLKNIRNLLAFLIDYQVIQSESVLAEVDKMFCSFKNLRILSVRKSTLGIPFYDSIKKLLINSNKLVELDLSDNKIHKEALKSICDGLKQNKNLYSLNISNCKLNDKSFQLLIKALQINTKLYRLDISENQLNEQSYLFFLDSFSISQCMVQTITCQQINGLFLLENNNQDSGKQIFPNLTKIDLSKNIIVSNEQLNILVHRCLKTEIFANLIQLNLDQCEINDKHCQIIQVLVSKETNVQELSLTQNKITCNGFKLLFEPILGNLSNLKILNVSKNQINDTFFSRISNDSVVNMNGFELLLLDGNQSDGSGLTGYITLLQKNPRLYIYNEWRNINEELAILIVESYILFTLGYNIKGESPYFITSIKIQDSDLSDSFFIWFGSKFFRFPQLEYFNFNGSKSLTSKGKMHMYINIINETVVNHKLREAYLSECPKPSMQNIFDDGLIRHYLIKLKSSFQNQNLIYTRQKYNSVETAVIEHIKWGFLGKWIIHIINKLLNFLQGQNIEFHLSNQLHNYIRQNQTVLKVFTIIGICVEVCKFILAQIIVLSAFAFDIDGWVLQARYGIGIYIFLIQILYLFANLYFALKIRQIAIPDYCIITTDMKRKIQNKLPHKEEIVALIKQFLFRLNYFFEVQLVVEAIKYLQICQDNYPMNNCQIKLIVYIVFTEFILFYQVILILYLKIDGTLQVWKKIKQDQGSAFNGFCLLAQKSHNYLAENVLRYFCPQTNVVIMNRIFNIKQIIHIVEAFTIQLMYFILYLIHIQFHKSFQQYHERLNTHHYIIIYIGLIKCFVQLIFHIFVACAWRPPQVKEFDLNEILLIRRYQSLGQFQHKKLIHKTQLINSQQQQYYNQQKKKATIFKQQNSLDQKLSCVKQSYSERFIIPKASQFQKYSEDLIPENISIQVPFQLYPNTSLKKLIDKYTG